MKIAMLTCLKANSVCTGAACFKAFNEKTKSFVRYEGRDDVQVAAFMKCNGCDSDPETDAGIREKVARLKREEIEVVHVGTKCTRDKEGVRCPNIAKIMDMIKAEGIEIVEGTH